LFRAPIHQELDLTPYSKLAEIVSQPKHYETVALPSKSSESVDSIQIKSSQLAAQEVTVNSFKSNSDNTEYIKINNTIKIRITMPCR